MEDRRTYRAHWDEETCAYFDSLPLFLQESIMQSGVEVEKEPDLRALAEELQRKA